MSLYSTRSEKTAPLTAALGVASAIVNGSFFLSLQKAQSKAPRRFEMKHDTGRVVSKARPRVLLRLALLQLTGSVVFSLALYFCFDLREALSAFFGGLIAVFASAFSAWQLYRGGQNLQAEEMLARFYISVVLKVICSLAMMAAFIIVIKVSVLPFVVAYLFTALVVNWLALLLPESLTDSEPSR